MLNCSLNGLLRQLKELNIIKGPFITFQRSRDSLPVPVRHLRQEVHPTAGSASFYFCFCCVLIKHNECIIASHGPSCAACHSVLRKISYAALHRGTCSSRYLCKDTLLRYRKREEKPSLQQDLNARPLDNEACALQLCHWYSTSYNSIKVTLQLESLVIRRRIKRQRIDQLQFGN